MEQQLKHTLTLSENEVAEAVIYWLRQKETDGFPPLDVKPGVTFMPPGDDQDYGINRCEVTWTRHAIVESE